MRVVLWIVIYILVQHTDKHGMLVRAFSCLTWKYQRNELQIIYKTKDFSLPLFFYGNDGIEKGFCDFKNVCDNQSIFVDVAKGSVVLRLKVDERSTLSGNWSSKQGSHIHSTYVTNTGDSDSSMQLLMKGNIIRQQNQSFVEVECSSCREPYHNKVYYVFNDVYGDVIYKTNTNGCSSNNGICNGFTCSCSTLWPIYQKKYKKDDNNEMIFTCSMTFNQGSKFIDKTSRLSFDGNNSFQFLELTHNTGFGMRYTTTPKLPETIGVPLALVLKIAVPVVTLVIIIIIVIIILFYKRCGRSENKKPNIDDDAETPLIQNPYSHGCSIIQCCLDELLLPPLRLYIKYFVDALYKAKRTRGGVEFSEDKQKQEKNKIELSKNVFQTKTLSYNQLDECPVKPILDVLSEIKEFPGDVRKHALKLQHFVLKPCNNTEIEEEEYKMAMETMKQFLLYLKENNDNLNCAFVLINKYGNKAVDEIRNNITRTSDNKVKTNEFGKAVAHFAVCELEAWVHEWYTSKNKELENDGMENQIQENQKIVDDMNEKETMFDCTEKGLMYLIKKFSDIEDLDTNYLKDCSNLRQKKTDLQNRIRKQIMDVKMIKSKMDELDQWCKNSEQLCTEHCGNKTEDLLKRLKFLASEFSKFDKLMSGIEQDVEAFCVKWDDAKREKGSLHISFERQKQEYNRVRSKVNDTTEITKKSIEKHKQFEEMVANAFDMMEDQDEKSIKDKSVTYQNVAKELVICTESMTFLNKALTDYPQAPPATDIIRLTKQYEHKMEILKANLDQIETENSQRVQRTDSMDPVKLFDGIAEMVKHDPNMRRRFQIGLCMNKIVVPHLRRYVSKHLKDVYDRLRKEANIDKQTSTNYKKEYSGTHLNYICINENHMRNQKTGEDLFDYQVKSHIDFSKLFLNQSMSHFISFEDESCDFGCLQSIVMDVNDFPETMQCRTIQLNVYSLDTWSDCKFSDWTDEKFKTAVIKIGKYLNLLDLEDDVKLKEFEKLKIWTSEHINTDTDKLAERTGHSVPASKIEGLKNIIHAIVTPLLRQWLKEKSTGIYKYLRPALQSQSYEMHMELYEGRVYLNYGEINNQRERGTDERFFEYKISNETDFTKLFLGKKSVQYSTLDELNDLTIILEIIQKMLSPFLKVWKTFNTFDNIVWKRLKYSKKEWNEEDIKLCLECIVNLVTSLDLPVTEETEQLKLLDKMFKGDEVPAEDMQMAVSRVLEMHLTNWKQDDALFVETSATRHVLKELRRENVIIVTGSSGSGKTSLIRHVALELFQKDQFDIIPIVQNEPGDIFKFRRENRKQVFVVDDLCGKYVVDNESINRWNTEIIDKLLEIFCNSEKESRAVLLTSCHRQVYKDQKFKVLNRLIKFECYLNSQTLKLSNSEKMIFLEKDHTKRGSSYYPMYYPPSYNCDYEILLTEFSILFKRNKFHLCAASLAILFENGFDTTYFETTHANDKILDIFKECGINSENKNEQERIKGIFSDMEGSFYQHFAKPNAFNFINDRVRHAAITVIFYLKPRLIIRRAESTLIAKKMRFQSTLFSHLETDFLFIPQKFEKVYFERIVNDMQSGDLVSAFSNMQLDDETYRNKWFTFISSRKDKMKRICDTVEKEQHKSLIVAATQTGFIDIVEIFIKLGCEVNARENQNKSALHVACTNGYTQIVEKLLEYQADVNVVNSLLQTPLHIACEVNNGTILKLLLEHVLNVNVKDIDGNSPLHIACKTKSVEIVKSLLEKNADPIALNKFNQSALFIACDNNSLSTCQLLVSHRSGSCESLLNNGKSSLHKACSKGLIDIVNLILTESSDVNWADENGNTSLHEACVGGFSEIVDILVCHNKILVDEKNKWGQTPLHIACNSKRASVEIVKELIKKHAHVNMSDDFGQLALHLACKNGSLKKVQLLIAFEASSILSDKKGNTALHYACQGGYEDVVRELINTCRSDINKCNEEGNTPLHFACHADQGAAIASVLINRNAKINQTNKKGESPLLIACKKQNKNVVLILLNLNESIDVNKQDNEGYSPLHYAALQDKIDISKMLLEKKAFVNITTPTGETPLHLAGKENRMNIIDLLLRYKADVKIKDKNGRPPIIDILFQRPRRHRSNPLTRF